MREEKKTMTTCAQVATPTLLATGRYTFTQNLVRDCLACGRSYATQFVEGLDSLWVTDLNREQAAVYCLDKMKTFRSRQVYDKAEIEARLREVTVSESRTLTGNGF